MTFVSHNGSYLSTSEEALEELGLHQGQDISTEMQGLVIAANARVFVRQIEKMEGNVDTITLKEHLGMPKHSIH